MSVSRRAYRAAMVAYPSSYRKARAAEILAAIDEGGSRFRPREIGGLLAGGLRNRGASAGKGALFGSWTVGCQIAALVIFCLVAAAPLGQVGWDVWYVRLGMHWPQDIPGASVFQYGDAYLARNLLGAAIPLCGVVAVCRGRVRIAIAASCAMSALYALPIGPLVVGSGAYAGGLLSQWHGAGVLAVQGGQVAFLAAPAAILWTSRRAATATTHHPLAWCALPFVLASFSLGGAAAGDVEFGLLATIVVLWALLARFDPRLGFAAFALTVAVATKLSPVGLIQPDGASYLLIITGAVCVAIASLGSALRYGSTSLR
jgi:hypothetical protein